jgi:hypothetical protein
MFVEKRVVQWVQHFAEWNDGRWNVGEENEVAKAALHPTCRRSPQEIATLIYLDLP